ncbi:MAG: hypothetical protein DSY83_18005 [Flavobacteriia bacterium]|nr:MAG: hypothetical protein DSY83_18005 [Flavobacteriia bacterium]
MHFIVRSVQNILQQFFIGLLTVIEFSILVPVQVHYIDPCSMQVCYFHQVLDLLFLEAVPKIGRKHNFFWGHKKTITGYRHHWTLFDVFHDTYGICPKDLGHGTRGALCSHNDGINIAASSGSKVKSSQSGTVAYVGNELKGYGNLIIIKHPNKILI